MREVREFIPSPLQCRTCWKFGHTKKKCKVVIVGSTNLAPMMRREMVRAKWEGLADKALVIAIEYPLFPLTKP